MYTESIGKVNEKKLNVNKITNKVISEMHKQQKCKQNKQKQFSCKKQSDSYLKNQNKKLTLFKY